MTAPADSGMPGLRPPRNQVDPRAVTWWRMSLAPIVVVPLLVLAALSWVFPPARFWLLVAATVIALIGVPVLLFLPQWWFRNHRWEATDTAVYTRFGYFWQEWRIAPLSRIQTVDTQRGPLERRFGLATVTVTTASAKGDLKIKGLDHQRAMELAEQLTKMAQAVGGDAT